MSKIGENMLFRKVTDKIDNWYKSNKTALLIDGARQVGKTTIIEEYLNNSGIDYVEFNLFDNKIACNAFNTAIDAEDLLLKLSAIAKKPMTKGKTVIFVDEAQEADDAITPIKFLVKNGSYRFIFSGSLLGVKMKDIQSIPIGFMSVINMYPMDFEEFLIANSVNKDTIGYLKLCYQQFKPVDSDIHRQIMNIFNKYLVVGGLPKAVKEYVETNNIDKVRDAQRDVDKGYLMDVAKYNYAEKLLIDDIYELIPSELNAKNKRFIIKSLDKKARYYTYESSLVWLKNSAIGLFTYTVDEPVYPLRASVKRQLFKLFLCDTGLLVYKLTKNTAAKILTGHININYGSIYESIVAQELTAHEIPLYYYNNKKHGEVDFLIEDNDQIIPIEVKSGKDYDRHVALNQLMNIENYHINKAYVLYNGNGEIKGKKIYMPIYFVMFI
ncbi:MAG: AAA family ATPase [Bacilli bacterium]|nr:AAA family ATPase [Bacilli bacterium]